MFPVLAPNDKANHPKGHVKLFSKRDQRRANTVQTPDLTDVGFGQFRHSVTSPTSYHLRMSRGAVPSSTRDALRMEMRSIPLTRRAAPLSRLVRVVVVSGPKPQMGRIAAGRVIARMAHAHSLGDGTFDQFVGNSMSQSCLSPDCEKPVPCFDAIRQPGPAAIRNLPVNLIEEAFRQWSRIRQEAASRAIFCRHSLKLQSSFGGCHAPGVTSTPGLRAAIIPNGRRVA